MADGGQHATGFVLSWATWVYIAGPLLDTPTPPAQALALTALFTVVSLVRQYIWRRFFNAGLHRVVQRAVLRLR
jgi:hypothetical protein